MTTVKLKIDPVVKKLFHNVLNVSIKQNAINAYSPFLWTMEIV